MLPPVERFLCESTVHSFVHFTGDRKVYVRFIWLAAFAVSFAFCCMRINEAFTKFNSHEVSTIIKVGALPFEFPDVYICNENTISGSYSVTLSDTNADLLNKFRSLVNESVVKSFDSDEWLDQFSVEMINTLPYRFLSDFMGHQIWQSVIDITVNDKDRRANAVLYRHNTYLNCMRLNLSDTDLKLLNNPSSRLTLTLFTDPPIASPYDNSTRQDVISSTNVKPYDWDINFGYDYTRAVGFRLFFVQRGHLPSEWSAQFVAGRGQRKEIELEMEDIVSKSEDFPGQCIDADDSFKVTYVSPYNGQKEVFGYEIYACLYQELARLSKERFNCSAYRYPLPWDYRDLPSCFNLTAVSALNLTDFYKNTGIRRSSLMADALKLCRYKAPCKRRYYSFKQSSTDWPSDRLLTEYLMKFITDQMFTYPAFDDKTFLPGIQYFLNNGSIRDAKNSLMQLTISASDEKSTETQLAIGYNFNSLIADAGGLLGLFLGMSLLSLLELLELLHDCILTAYQRFEKKNISASVQSDEVKKETWVDGTFTAK